MKDLGLSKFIREALNEDESEGKVTNEKEFRQWAEAKFEEVFGDELDKKRMKQTIDGFLRENKDLVDKGDWGELVGMMNASFGK